MSLETDDVSISTMPLVVRCKSPTSLSPTMSRVYSRTMIKSLENIISEDNTKEKLPNKKLSAKMRRSVTLKDVSDFKLSRRSPSNITFDRIKIAKSKVDDAIQKGKIFTVLGPYSRIREVLRNRGWVEKFYLNTDTLNNSSTRKSRSSSKSSADKGLVIDEGDDIYDDADDDDIDDDNDDGEEGLLNGLPPWEEEDGIYGIMSRMLKNIQPNLFWTLRKGQVDYKNLRKDQIINHHAKAGSFTTKTGLAKCLNQLRWYDDKEPDEFFPRCFTISTLEEKHAFIDDFHFTACASLIKEVMYDANDSCTDHDELIDSCNNIKGVDVVTGKSNKKILPKIKYCDKRKEKNGSISYKFLDMAIAYCEFIMKIKSHEDIDRNDFIFCWSCDWEEFLENYYKVVHEGFQVEGAYNEQTRKRCTEISHELRKIFPQFDMEGSRNVWILKPGAKSRGRGIMCYSRLNDVLKLLTHSFVANENRFIVQKYIERPLLIYNTKFDIRQWFMVTDWNPLTVWWYKDCYLRFCSQQYTLDDFNEAVHLSNNSIQYKYQNGPRSDLLPPENMWDWIQFEQWMKREGFGNAYNAIILPGMKEAVIDVLLCVQDNVEWRKNTFEIYGADFMVSENDLKPWLIEINSSPCMSASTSITARLTSAVLEDVFKVVLDRRENKQCDTGRFELIFKQNAIFVPPYIGIDLKLAGTSIKNPVPSTVLTERRSSTRPITDSSILRQIKNKEDKQVSKRIVNEAPVLSTITSKKESTVKPIDKSNALNKRSNTSIVINSAQTRQRSSSNKLNLSHPGPVSSVVSNYIIQNTNENNELDNVKSIMKITHAPSLVEKVTHAPSLVEKVTHAPSLVEKVTHTPSLVEKSNERPSTELLKSATKSSSVSRTRSNTSDKSKSESKDEKIRISNSIKVPILPNVTKLEYSPKSTTDKLERQYKLPTKVELVNFSLAKKIIHSTINDTNLKKKKKNSRIFKRPSNSQIFLQKSAVWKPNASSESYYRSLNKHINFQKSFSFANKFNYRPRSCSKSASSSTLIPCMSILLSKRHTNNNHITVINFSTPVMY